MHSMVIYDGLCNLCVNLVQWLEGLDEGRQFRYVPMQDQTGLERYEVAPGQCEAGMILIDPGPPERRYQGSAAAEEIARRMPGGEAVIAVYRSVPGLSELGDGCYVRIRDHRYDWFGRRSEIYCSTYPPVVSVV
ncbi:MAG: DUF393 domain-containing protein [Aphanocapsa lilacina HA4352-LM1]|nr:DUF393 domain-containing protein [Aphanocapsa lilacina HA4352-LM1]